MTLTMLYGDGDRVFATPVTQRNILRWPRNHTTVPAETPEVHERAMAWLATHGVGMGFGFESVYPVLIACIQATVPIEIIAPETGLHPRVQVELTDVFLCCPQDVTIRTHGEAFLLRVQRRIRGGVIGTKDVEILYLPQEWSSGAWAIRLDEGGDLIDEWPDNLFDVGFNERFAR